MRYVLALDQGTTSSRAIVFDHSGTPRGAAQREFRQIYPQPGWVEHDPDEIWTTQARVMHDAVEGGRSALRRHRGDRHHQPARDHRAVGARDRQAHRQRDRLAGPAHGGPLRCACARPGTRRSFSKRDRTRDRSVFLRHQARMAARPRAGRARTRASAASSPSAPSTPGSSGSSPAAPSTSPTPPTHRARCSSTSTPAPGTTSCSRSSTFRERCCRRSCRRPASAPTRSSTARRCRSPASPATSRQRCSARPASRRASRRTPTAPAASCC